jgi:predicted nucleotide-binding protein (sugar kinase/HSP70/actin superfamily)
MKIIKHKDLKEKIHKGMIVKDLQNEENGIVVKRNPLTIELDTGDIIQRSLDEIEFYVWDETDIKEINKRAKKLKDFFN